MARMIPSPMAADTESEAERMLYRKFEEELPDHFTVIHQARWIGRRHGLEGQDGEADFVIIHPDEGILVLEAKGGAIEIDDHAGVWRQRKGSDVRDLRQSPLQQAADSKHVLLRRLTANRALQGRQVHLVHAACLPHVSLGSKDLGPAAPRERVLDAQALQAVEGAVLGALRSADRSRPDLPPLGKDGVKQVVDALAVRRRLTLSTPVIASEVRRKIATLTDEQFDLLRTLAHVPRVQVTGGPGTGKTVLAIEAARRLAAQGLDTLLLCFNAPLGGFLTAATADVEELTATHFHALCRSMATEAGLGAELQAAENNDGYRDVFPELLLEASEKLGRTFDALVVDEAQDFQVTWWAALEGCLKEGSDSPLYLFEDELQSLDERSSADRPSGLVGPFALTRDCRNTDEIHAFLAACPGGPQDLRPSGVTSGILPRVQWIEDAGKLPRRVSATVARLIQEWNVPPGEIVVLTPRAPKKSALGKVDRLGPAPTSWRERESDRHVLIDTIHRFKGLEATAVVLAELTPDVRPDIETCLRVGCSRPTIHLDLLASTELQEALLPALTYCERTA